MSEKKTKVPGKDGKSFRKGIFVINIFQNDRYPMLPYGTVTF